MRALFAFIGSVLDIHALHDRQFEYSQVGNMVVVAFLVEYFALARFQVARQA